MIPTRHKSKLPETLSWPLGAEAISAALGDAPHAADLTLRFSDSPVWPASEFQLLLRESLPYVVLCAEYQPESRPGYAGSASMSESGFFDTRWEVRVNPVPRSLRAAAAALLRDQGLPLIVDWLRSSRRGGWLGRYHRVELVWAPAAGTLSERFFDGV